MFPLTVHSGGRYLIDSSNNPFLIQGDTPWSLEVQLTQTQIDTYLNSIQSKGFNSVLFECMEHKFSDQTPPEKNVAGDVPFVSNTDFSVTNNAYWNNVDYCVSGCLDRNILCIITPAYLGFGGGDEGWNSEVTSNTAAHLFSYGQFLANRYTQQNIIWMLGGDYAGTQAERNKQAHISSGILSIRPTELFSGHPQRTEDTYSKWSSYSGFRVNNIYTDGTEYSYAATAYAKSPPIPFFLIEGRYEGETGGDDTTVRRQPYATILSGGCGGLFGSKYIWDFGSAASSTGGAASALANHLDSTARNQQAYLPLFFNQFEWWKLTPKTDTSLVTTSLGTGTSRVIPALAYDNSFAMIWTPSVNFTADLSKINSKYIRRRWFNPSNGTYTDAGSPLNNTGTYSFIAPGERILVLDQYNSVKLSNYAQSGIFNHLLRTSTLNKPSTISIALCSKPPDKTSTGSNCNELSNTGGYARYPNASGDVFWSHQSDGSGRNISQIIFNEATADWGYVSGLALVDNSTYGAGNILMYGALTTPKNIKTGHQFVLNAENLSIFID